jgi:hypothetical protein
LSVNHPPTIDLNEIQDRRDAVAHQPSEAQGIKTLVNGSGHATRGSQREDAELPAEPQASPPVPQLGAEAAANMTKLARAAAADIRQLGQLAFDAGKRVQEECEQMARDVEENGGTVALHLTGLSQLLAAVGLCNRDTLRRLVGGLPPSAVSRADESQLTEQPAMEDVAHTAPPSKGRGARISGWIRS